jgi:hypothetical protein
MQVALKFIPLQRAAFLQAGAAFLQAAFRSSALHSKPPSIHMQALDFYIRSVVIQTSQLMI